MKRTAMATLALAAVASCAIPAEAETGSSDWFFVDTTTSGSSDWFLVDTTTSGSSDWFFVDTMTTGSSDWFFVDTTIPDVDAYTIVFEPGVDNVRGSMESQVVGIGKVARIRSCAFVHPSGLRFAGWKRTVDINKGLYRRYDDGVLVFNLAEPGAVVVMEAVWE